MYESRELAMKAKSARQAILTFAPSLFILLVMVVASVYFQMDISIMTKDVASIVDIHPFSGILSNLGVLLWCATTSVCYFSATILRNANPREPFWFLLASSVLSAYLLFDDFFLFHEELAPRYFNLNEEFIVLVLGMAVFAYLVAFRRIILGTNYVVLVLALGFLSTSVAIDKIFEPWLWHLEDWSYLIEDGTKWLGIASWCSYYVHTSHQLLVSVLRLNART